MTTPEIPEQVRRWTAKRRPALVLTILKGETSGHEAALRSRFSPSKGHTPFVTSGIATHCFLYASIR